jgi:hypothetical protein
MRNWKKAKAPAMRHRSLRFISGLARELAIETEKASIASPTPSRILLNTKMKIEDISSSANETKKQVRDRRTWSKNRIKRAMYSVNAYT